MNDTIARVRTVRQFKEGPLAGRGRVHVLATYDTGELRVLIDRCDGEAVRLLAVLNDGQEGECLDGSAQINAICREYMRRYKQLGGPLACPLTREHLIAPRRDQARTDAGPCDGESTLVLGEDDAFVVAASAAARV